MCSRRLQHEYWSHSKVRTSQRPRSFFTDAIAHLNVYDQIFCSTQNRVIFRPCASTVCCTCVEEDRSRFHGSQHRLSQSVDGPQWSCTGCSHAFRVDERLRLRVLLNTEQRALSRQYASSTAASIDEPKTHAPSFFLSFSLALHVVCFAFLLWCHARVSFRSFVVQGRTGQVDCRSDPEKNCSSHGLLVTQLPKVRSRVEECARPSGIVEGKDRRSPGMLFRGRQDERWWHVQPQFVCVR